MTVSRTEPDAFEILTAIAVRYGVSFDALMTEIAGPSTLARLTRDLLGLQDLAIPPAKRGAGPRTAENWDLYVRVTLLTREGYSTAGAIREYLAGRGDTDGRLYEATEQKFYRLQKMWSSALIPAGLAALFMPPPK